MLHLFSQQFVYSSQQQYCLHYITMLHSYFKQQGLKTDLKITEKVHHTIIHIKYLHLKKRSKLTVKFKNVIPIHKATACLSDKKKKNIIFLPLVGSAKAVHNLDWFTSNWKH